MAWSGWVQVACCDRPDFILRGSRSTGALDAANVSARLTRASARTAGENRDMAACSWMQVQADPLCLTHHVAAGGVPSTQSHQSQALQVLAALLS